MRVTSITHPEATGRTNDFLSQQVLIADAIQPQSPVSLQQMNLAIANATTSLQFDGTFYYYSPTGQRLFEIQPPAILYSTNLSIAIDGTGTNWAVSIATNNFVSGWQFQMSTNLALVAGFQQFTNYVLTTNSGVATFTISMAATPNTYAFFRIVSPQQGALKSDYVHSFLGGTIYASNSFNLATITNGMGNMSFWTGNSNGQALVSVWVSNGVPWIKRLAP